MHPSFVYGAKFHPSQEDNPQMIVATICFDCKIRLWNIHNLRDERYDPPIELSILDKPPKTLGQKESIYDLNHLDDETLALIMKPEKMRKFTHQVVKEEKIAVAGANGTTINATKKVTVKVTKEVDGTVFDKIHPNCLCFSDLGRLFVGDSKGTISVWDVELRHGEIKTEYLFKITHKELEGD